jgi:3-hydroxyisobutyrate dehydrogenase-like beta-hydroxyacid dehydrogenase
MISSVAVIGVGAMGMGIARSLLRHGFTTVARDVDPQREAIARAAGARVAGSAREAGASAQAVAIVVVDSAQIEQVLSGDDGLLAALGPGRLVFLCSTISPGDAEAFAARIAATGAQALDAPISGGPARAEAGTMSIMLAGPDAALQAAAPVLDAIAGRRFVISSRHGDGARAKLVNNLMAGIHLMAGAEALALAVRLGLDPRQTSELIGASSGQSWMFDDRMPRALAGDYAPRAQAHVLTKDLTLANEAAATAGVRLPLGEVARDLLRATCEGGWRDEDDAAALKYYLRRFGAALP